MNYAYSNNIPRLAKFSQCMAVITLALIALMFISNLICWIFPEYNSSLSGLSFSISILEELQINTDQLPLWQLIGGIALSSLPLFAFTIAAIHLYSLFRLYAKKTYFTLNAATHLEKVGRYIIIGVITSLVIDPVLSIWLTFTAPEGQRSLLIGLSSSDLLTLFLGTCFWMIACILKEASCIYNENQSFI